MNTKLIPFSREQVDLMRQTLTRVMPLEIAPALSNNGPISGFFLADPPHVKKGESLELTWSVRNATKATLSGPNLPPRPVALEGTFTLTPTNDGTYVLVVEGPGSTLTMSALAVVEVVTPPPQPDPGEDGVVYDLSSTVEIDTVLIGSDPGSHGLHVDHSHPPRFFGDVTITAVKDGFWSDPTVWNLNRIPIAGDVVRIPTKMRFAKDRNTLLKCVLLAVNTDGTLIMDGSDSDYTMEVIIVDQYFNYTLDPGQWGHGVLSAGNSSTGGIVQIYGKPKTSWCRLSQEAEAGDTVIYLDRAVTGWQAGDQILIPDTRQIYNSIDPLNPGADHTRFIDIVTVASVAGDGLSVTLQAPGCLFNHYGVYDVNGTLIPALLAPIGNLSRNVRIESENKDGTRGHMLFHGRSTVNVQYLEIHNMGRTTNEVLSNYNGVTPGSNQIGRYPLHCHHLLGPLGLTAAEPQFFVDYCAVWNDDLANRDLVPRWSISIHRSHYGRVSNCVIYNASGSGIVPAEDGPETKNIVDSNFICRVAYVTWSENFRGTADAGHTGCGLWMRGMDNYIRNNVVNMATRGYVYSPYMAINGGANFHVPAFKGADPETDYNVVNLKAVPVLQFFNNEVGGMTYIGMENWFMGVGADNVSPIEGMQESVFSYFKTWHMHTHTLYNYTTNKHTMAFGEFRNDYSLLRTLQGGGLAFFHSDYAAANFKVVNCEIMGYGTGWLTGPLWDPQEFINCRFGCYVSIECFLLWAAGRGGDQFPPRRVNIINCVYDDINMEERLGPLGPKANIKMNGTESWGPGASNAWNIIVDNEVFVYDYNGVNGDDFKCYWNEQEQSAILRQTEYFNESPVIRLQGSPVAGLTNAQNWATYSIAWGGELMPLDATTKTGVINGKVKAF